MDESKKAISHAIDIGMDRFKKSMEAKEDDLMKIITDLIKQNRQRGLYFVRRMAETDKLNRHDSAILGDIFKKLFPTSKFTFTIPDSYGHQFNESSMMDISDHDYEVMKKFVS
jgi:hypothetical protein